MKKRGPKKIRQPASRRRSSFERSPVHYASWSDSEGWATGNQKATLQRLALDSSILEGKQVVRPLSPGRTGLSKRERAGPAFQGHIPSRAEVPRGSLRRAQNRRAIAQKGALSS